MSHQHDTALREQARVLTLGAARGPVAAAIVPPRSGAAAGVASIAGRLRTLASVRAGRYDALHLADARLAPLGRWIRRRSGVAVSVDVGPQDLAALTARPRLAEAIGSLDAAFVFGEDGERALRSVAPRVPCAPLPFVALAPGEPPRRAVRRVSRALSGADPLRPVVVLPWNPDIEAWRGVAGLLRVLAGAGVVCLAAGVPGEREARRLRSGAGTPSLRVHVGALDDAAVTAVARCADAFIVPWRLAPGAPGADALGRVALAASGVPVVASDCEGNILEHERNAFLVREGDVAGYAATVTRLLDVPARQRHYMGAEFAAWTLRRWPLAPAVDAYEERLAAIAGRAEVPRELRAAA